MLQGQSEFVRDCLERAARARELALAAADPAIRAEYLAQEERWLGLARSGELSERLSRFLSSRPNVGSRPTLALRDVDYERGQVLFTEGERIRTVYFTETAVISVRVGSIEVATIGDQGGVGALAALDGGTVHYRAVVLLGGRGFACAATQFRQTALENRALLEATLRFERQISTQIANCAHCNIAHPLAARLARWLARVHDLSGQTRLVFTQEMMAEWLGFKERLSR